jgi:hypothetical protein
MGLNIHGSIEDMNAAVRSEEQEDESPPAPRKVKSQPKASIQVDYTKVIIALIFCGMLSVVVIFLSNMNKSHQTAELSKQSIEGTIVSKLPASKGGIMLNLDNGKKIVLTADMKERFTLQAGTKISVKANILGEDIYTCSVYQDIKILTSIVDYDTIYNVNVKNHVGTFEHGQGLARIILRGLDDGVYSELIICKDSEGNIQVLKAMK